ncbi:MAG: glycine cleavage system protein GcvH [Proteobacteria bacterium]|nr:glycine cleavage system protein GcvH [Burkholderiales bacterium]
MSTGAADLPDDRRYSATHQWARRLASGQVEIGITAYAQDALGDIVFADLPAIGATIVAGESFMVIESVKIASDVHAPLGGVVEEVNETLRDQPEALNADPFGAWLVRVAPDADSSADSALLDAASYARSIASG